MLFSKRFYHILVAIALIFLIIYLGTLVSFVFDPLVVFAKTVFLPFLIAGILFYIFRPIVNFLHEKKLPRGISILIIYIGFIALIVGFVFLVGPPLQKQFVNLMDNMPNFIDELRLMIIQLQEHEWVAQFQESENFSLEEIGDSIYSILMGSVDFFSANLGSFIGTVTNVVLTIVLIPFILYYVLKDGHKVPNRVLGFFPKKHRFEGEKILKDMDGTISSYIQGQLFVSFCVGVLIYISYLILGVDYSLILAIIAMVTNLIPFVGPWLGAIPAVLVAFISSPILAVWVVAAIVVVQQVESNLISPQVVGRKLDLHPLTIIITVLVAGRFLGVIGFLVAVPTYAIVKVIISHSYRLYQLRKEDIATVEE